MLGAETESVLGLVNNRASGRTVDSFVLRAAELVADRLGMGLGRVWLDTANSLVTGTSNGFLGLGKC